MNKSVKILVALLITAILTTTVMAVLYLTKTIPTIITVSTTGAIELYNEVGCASVLSSMSFTFTGAEALNTLQTKDIYVKNTGNVPVILRWYQIGTGWTWNSGEMRYENTNFNSRLNEGGNLKSKNDTVPWTHTLASGAVYKVTFSVDNKISPIPVQTNTFTVYLEASDV